MLNRLYPNESNEPTLDTRAAAEKYIKAGVAVIPVPRGEKGPNLPGWQKARHTVEDVPRLWTNGQGVGVLWGEPSGGLVDVDLDWQEARAAAPHILPQTRTFGRPGSPESHWIYRVTGDLPKTKNYGIGGKGDDQMVTELLSTGRQSLVPPSLHGSGERRQWYRAQPATEVAGGVLVEVVADVATAALLARNWPGKGSRNFYVMAATGYVGRHLPRPRAEKIMRTAIAVSGDEEFNERLRTVEGTLDNLEAGVPVTGGPTLDSIAEGIVGRLRHWHGWGGERDPHVVRDGGTFNLTDMGNGERLVHRHGDNLRYCPQLGGWFTWDGTHWRPDDTGEVERLAKETIRSIYAEAGREEDEGRRKALADHARRSEARTRVEAMIALARSEAGIPRRADEFDRDEWLLNCPNGTVNLKSGELREHRREDMITKLAGSPYDPQAEAPRFEQFLREVLVEDDVIGFVRRFAGYSLTGSTRERIVVILHGRGKNGKSTLVELLQDVLGDYGTTTDTETILAKRHQGVGNDVAALKGARFVAAAEVEKGRRLAESKVKQLTGNDTVTARFLYSEPFSFRPEFKLWLSTNNKPEIHGMDDAIWDRLRLIPFDQRFVGDAADPELPEKLRDELPGILRWMVRGCAEWLSEGLGEPEVVRAATEDYRADMDTLAAFIEDRCMLDPNAWVRFSDLWAEYQDWCQESGEKAETKRGFGGRLRERGFEPVRGTGNAPIRRGIGLRDNRDPGPEGGSRVTGGAESYPTVTEAIPPRYEGNADSSYRSYPKNTNFGPNTPRDDTSEKQGNSGNSGNSQLTEDDWVDLDDLVQRRQEELGRCTGQDDCLCDQCLPS